MEAPAGKQDPVYQIVGLVRNTKYYELREEFQSIAFLPMAHEDTPGTSVRFVIRTRSGVGDVMSAIKSTVAEVNPDIGLEFRVLTRQLNDSLLRERLMATLSGVFGLLAGLLATVGLYGVIAYMVEKRRNEIGVRMALGADRARVVWLVVREAGMLLVLGLIVGAGLSIWAGKAAATLLYGLKPNDPVTIGGAVALLTLVALLATYAPARRASQGRSHGCFAGGMILTQRPALAEGRLQVLVGFVVVAEAHLRSIPFQLAFDAQRDNAKQHPFDKRSGDVEVRTGRVAAFAGPNPVAIVARRPGKQRRGESIILHLLDRQQASLFAIGSRRDACLYRQ